MFVSQRSESKTTLRHLLNQPPLVGFQYASVGISCMFVIRRTALELIGSGLFMRRNKRVRIKRSDEWCGCLSLGHMLMLWLCEARLTVRTKLKLKKHDQVWDAGAKISVTTKLTAAIGFWGSGNQKKSLPLSPSSSPPQTPDLSSASPEKSPSFKSRFFNNYMKNDKRDGGNKGEPSVVVFEASWENNNKTCVTFNGRLRMW